MDLTSEELAKFIHDPDRVQRTILDMVEASTNGEIVITEPTNPFMMLLEATAVTSANAVTSPVSLMRKLYPNLATSPDELYHHLADDELANMFSVPSVATMVFYINLKALRSYGYRPVDGTYVETVLPIGTEVVITGVTFTLLNNISVRLMDNGVVFAEQQTSSNDIAINGLGVLPSGIVSFEDGEPWILIETRLKQVKRHIISKPITTAKGFDNIVSITDSYFYSDVYYNGLTTGGVDALLTKTHSEDYINPSVPTVFISAIDKTVRFKIPDIYLISGAVSGNAVIELYETIGELHLPIHKYRMEEYQVNVPSKGSTPAMATVSNMILHAMSTVVVNGGSNGLTLDELKTSIINNSTGDIDVPVTTTQIVDAGRFDGFEIYKSMDVITGRLFVASKNLPKLESELVYSKPDLFFNAVSVDVTLASGIPNVTIHEDYILIPANTVFKEVNNIIEFVDGNELEYIDTLTDLGKIAYFKKYKYFYTPYYYITDVNSLSKVEARVYDLDHPSMDNIKITAKNTNLLVRVNTAQYVIVRTTTGYKVVVSLTGNGDFNNTDLSLVRGQLSIPLLGGTEAHFQGTYDPINNFIAFEVNTNLYITEEHRMELSNGNVSISRPTMDLSIVANIYLYTLDPNVIDETNYLVNDIKSTAGSVSVLSRESIDITFGRNLEYLWNRVHNTYTDRKYLKYDRSQAMYYETDVYQEDPVTGSIYSVIDVDGVPTASKTKLHSAGDLVKDDSGSIVYKYQAGDIVLDNDGLPTIDMLGGVVRNLDIFMLEYEYKLATSTVYTNYLVGVMEIVNSWILNNVPTINDSLLENTKVLYKSYKSAVPVTILSNDTSVRIPYSMSPAVTIYTTRTNFTDREKTILVNEIGFIMHEYLDMTTIRVSDIKNKIIDTLDADIVGVKIDGLESEVFNIIDKTTRLVVNKQLSLSASNELTVRYDVNLTIHTI